MKKMCAPISGIITNIELLNAYLESLRLRKFSSATLRCRAWQVKQFLLFLQDQAGPRKRIRDVDLEDLERFRAHLVQRQFAPTSVIMALGNLRLWLRYLEEHQYIFSNPARDLIVKRAPNPLQHVPSEKEVRKLLAQPNPATARGVRDRAMLEIFYSTGVRRHELAGLSLFDPDLERGVLRVLGKGRKERLVPLGKQAVCWLRQYLKAARPRLLGRRLDEHALWINRAGRPLSIHSINRLLKEYCADAGLRGISPHALRRACATHMLNHGAHPVQIQMLLGHASLLSLSHYLRVSITELKAMHKKSKPGK